MKIQLKHLLLFLVFGLSPGQIMGQIDSCDQVIEGRVIDLITEKALPYATVSIVETGQGVIVDEEGEFLLENICIEEVHLEIRFVGYKTTIHHHDFHHGNPVIYLAPDTTLLESVVIEATRLESVQSLSIQRLEVDKAAILGSSVGELTQQLSGISMLNTGTNISKPIVHGLHSNRVLVMNDGLRHAYQVWGDGHAPEIDPSHINEIEVVKGAGTVKYGPEALGGVVLYNSKVPILDQKINGSFGSSYRTNGRAYSTQLNLEQGSHRFAWNVSAFGVKQGDLRAPDYNLSNTGKREYGGSFNSMFHQPKFELKVSGSFLGQELGILRGSLVGNLQDLQNAILRSEPSPTFEPTYEIQNPRHRTQHGLIKSDLSLFLGDHLVNFKYGVQKNVRREFDVRRGELNNRPVIDLNLVSHTFETEYMQAPKGNWTGNSGIQFFSQNSVNQPGSNPINFVPDYEVLNLGIYTVQSISFDNSILELGVRFDHQTLSVVDTIRDVTIYSNEVAFSNATFTLGFKRELNENLTIFSNLGTAWRPPNVAELYSFGYHFSRIQFGLWRYDFSPNITTPLNRVFDETDRDVPSERSLKWITGLEIKSEKVNAEFIFHVNRINNYIYLRPFGVTTNVAGTFPYFIFSQSNALFLGSDWDLRYRHSGNLTSEVKVAYIYARETENNHPFIEIPPFNINYALDYNKGKWGVGLNFNYMAQQWNTPTVIEPAEFGRGSVEVRPDEIFDFMRPPEQYLLVGCTLSYSMKSLDVKLRGENLLNKTYRSYTDRLRYFGDAPGRNVIFTIDLKF